MMSVCIHVDTDDRWTLKKGVGNLCHDTGWYVWVVGVSDDMTCTDLWATGQFCLWLLWNTLEHFMIIEDGFVICVKLDKDVLVDVNDNHNNKFFRIFLCI